MSYIYSTMSNDNVYPLWIHGATARPAVSTAKVLILGKANVINSQTLVTPRGVATEVTADELVLLKGNKHFNRHVELGFLTIDEKSKRVENADKAADNMTPKDASAQLVDSDFANKQTKPKKSDE